MRNSKNLKIFAGSSHPKLAEEICETLGVPLGKMSIGKFSNENIKVKIEENVRGADVFVIQTSCPPVNEMLMELFIIIDALKYASAGRITAVLPYYPYVRSDKKDEPRISITARLVADLLKAAGADRILTMNLHAPQIQGFFRIPADQLTAAPILYNYFSKMDLSDGVVVAPDVGRAKFNDIYAGRLGLPLAIIDKRRHGDDEAAEVRNVIGDVKGKRALIFDDEILTGGTILEAVRALKRFSAKSVYVSCVHPVLSGNAAQRLNEEEAIEEVVVTDTLPIPPEKSIDKLRVLSVASLFARAIGIIHRGTSISALFQ
ncbi:MAG: ribose-phosphate diphosphokinase [bacterium]